jgi:outer membrane receptor for ferrienterochelin and colicins
MVLVSPVLFGQTDTMRTENNLNEVIITGQYGQNSLTRSVYKVKVLDEKRIQLQGAVNVKDVIANELNVRIANDPALGSSMSVQGLSGQNIKIMIDGVPVAGREGGNIDLAQLNLANIERIEFIEGPMSVNFGTDALGGVINLITKKQSKAGYSTTLNAYVETIGQYNAGIATHAAKGNWAVDINLNRNFFDGYHTRPDSRIHLWKPRTQYFGDVAITRQLNKGSIRLQSSIFHEKVTNRDSAYITPWYAYANDQYFYTIRQTNSAFFNKQLGRNYTADAVVSYTYYNRVRNSFRKNLQTLEEQLIPQNDLHDTATTQYWMSRGTVAKSKENSKLNWQTGYEVNHETFIGSRIRDGRQTITDYNLFASAEWRALPQLIIRPGLRAIYNTQFDAPLIPSLNIKWDVGRILVIRASYGKGFRAPSLKELHLNFVDPSHNVQGNPNLQAEKQDNYQLNATLEWSKFERIFRVEPSLFYNDVSDKIDLARLSSNTVEAGYFNISRFQSAGFNLNTEYRAPRYTFILGYAYTGIQNSLLRASSVDNFFFSQEARFNINYTFLKPAFTFAVFYRYNSRMQLMQYEIKSGELINGFIDPYHMVDATLNKSFFKNKLTITTGIKNILNVININASLAAGVHAAQTNAAMVGMGRTAFIQLNYRIDWNRTNS